MSKRLLNRKQLFILPSNIGWYFTVILLSLFGIAIKFNDQGAFILLFLLVATGYITLLLSHRNVSGLQLHCQPQGDVFCSQKSEFLLTITRAHPEKGKALYLHSQQKKYALQFNDNGQSDIVLTQRTHHRGKLTCPKIRIYSHYPLGLFLTWSRTIFFNSHLFVYPEKVNMTPIKKNNASNEQGHDFDSLTNYKEGDSLQRIFWPAYAKHQQMVIKNTTELTNNNKKIHFNFSQFSKNNSLEHKLQQLSYWVDSAKQSNQMWMLSMPNKTFGPSSGELFAQECLRYLATYQ